jgi:hypothetical protein
MKVDNQIQFKRLLISTKTQSVLLPLLIQNHMSRIVGDLLIAFAHIFIKFICMGKSSSKLDFLTETAETYRDNDCILPLELQLEILSYLSCDELLENDVHLGTIYGQNNIGNYTQISILISRSL